MLFNYLTTSWRNLVKYRLSTLINILGLGLAIACCTIFYSIIAYETTFDNWHSKADRIYRVIIENKDGSKSAGVHFPAAEELRQDFWDWEIISEAHGPQAYKISVERSNTMDHYNEPLVVFADAHFLEILDFETLTSVDPSILNQPDQVLLTEKLVIRYFGSTNAVGKIIYLNNNIPLEVAGVLADPPGNTNLSFNMLVSNQTYDKLEKDRLNDWLFFGDANVYVTLKENESPAKYLSRLETFTEKNAAFYKTGDYYYRLIPLKDYHTSSGFGLENHYKTPSELIYIPAFLGIIILVFACFNFINLSTAKLLLSTREWGIRKVIGSSRMQLLIRYFIENAIVILLALLVGILVSIPLLKEINSLFSIVQFQLEINSGIGVFLILLGSGLVIITGFYPMLLLLKFKPIEAIKSKLYGGKSKSRTLTRKMLIIFQLSGTAFLFLFALVVFMQLNLWEDMDRNFKKVSVLIYDIPSATTNQYTQFKTSLSKLAEIEAVTFSNGMPGWGEWGAVKLSGEKEFTDAVITYIDHDFFNVYKTDLTETDLKADNQKKVFISQKLVKYLEFEHPEEIINKELVIDKIFGETFSAPITAVVEDVIDDPINNSSSPIIYVLGIEPDHFTQAHVGIYGNYNDELVSRVDEAYAAAFPDEVIEHTTIEDVVYSSYLLEQITKKGIVFGTVMALLISAIGLFGVISFMNVARQKEMCIRKVYGATGRDIIKIYSKEFLILALLAYLFAIPFELLFINQWLQQYVNRISLQPDFFILTFLVIVFLIFISVIFRVLQSSRSNPGEVLRSEN
ncbi:MAG: ABC transporter permease [Candidatus Cyclobacteriaceae bacterium M2_1C_046]